MVKNGYIRAIAGTLVAFGMALGLGCVDPPDDGSGGGGGGTSLYVFDSSNGAANYRVLVYSDIATLLNNPETVPSKRLRSSLLEQVKDLAWGGMCFDANNNRLYMVSETGGVVRIDRARSQQNNVEIPALEIVFFRLGESDSQRLPNGKFGQAAVDPRSGDLYVAEYSSSESRIWIVAGPGGLSNGTSVAWSADSMINLYFGDGGGGTGLAVGTGGAVYVYVNEGSSFTLPTTGVSYSGPRLRRGTSSGFQPINSLIIGESSNDKPKLGRYGSLAVDSSGNVFFAKHLFDNVNSSAPSLLMFGAGQFNPGMNVEPNVAFSSVPNLRVLSHAFTKDWLVGATCNNAGTEGSGTLWIWRMPTMGANATSKELNLGSSLYIRGLALDGSN
ncbi:MAG: hypothetical protein LBC63_00260 [Holophagales bacterium]|jgi:hypothetical protein|nr:hypothetical protein [Holophagales bacterium]